MRTPTLFAVLAAAVACSSGDEPTAPRFTPIGADVVRDARMGRVWRARDSGRALSWIDADRHCRELGLGSSGAAWRLPSIEELAALYDPSMQQPCGEAAICRIDPAIHLSSPYQWSATAPQPDRRVYYDFALGSQLAPLIRPTLTRGALCTGGEQDDNP
jgi:hypothetical protein